MSPEALQWIRAAHVVGFLVWTAGLLSCVHLLRAHQALGPNAALSGIERRVAMTMDIAALVAIVAGLALAFGVTPSAFKNGGWLHIKLTAVVLGLIGLHGFVRVKIRKFRSGAITPLPGFLYPATLAVIVLIAVIAVVKPFARY